MEALPLGTGPLAVSRIGFGCMGLSSEPRDDAAARRVLRHAVDQGITLFDTADRYGRGHNEQLLGEAFRGMLDEVVVATKFGFVGAPGQPGAVDGTPAYLRRACDASLGRLGAEAIDLYYLHRLDPDVPIEETVGAMAELVHQGKVRALGLSEVGVDTLQRAAAVHPIAALQTEYSLWTREPEAGLLDACREIGTTFVAYGVLGSAFLAGAVTDPQDAPVGSRMGRSLRLRPPYRERNLALLEVLWRVAGQVGCTPAQLALAWVLDAAPDAVPIPGTRDPAHCDENLQALSIRLAPEHRAALDAGFAPDLPAGPRKSRLGMDMVGR